MAQKPETNFRTYRVDPFLKSLGALCYPMSIQQSSLLGDPDKVLCIGGRFVALELKASRKVPSGLQAFKLDQVVLAGGVALVARPENWEQVKQILEDLAFHGIFCNPPPWRSLL